ncbi:MAG: type I methionyl aminopeptidase [Gemmatimonadetes bacterium]|nr:type I methionyl aminopeptidase [Gemmatimonadota bacterium]
MAEAGRLLTESMAEVGRAVRPGVTPRELDRIAHDAIVARGAIPAQLGYQGYPATICLSKNEIVVHGIPDDVPLREGDIVTVDFALIFRGFYADMARTLPVGTVGAEAQLLVRVTEEAFWKGFAEAQPGKRMGDVSAAVQRHIESAGFWVVREFVGHGIGTSFHEDPQVPNYGRAGRGPQLRAGMTFALEPMAALRAGNASFLKDGWTATMGRGNLAAQYENTIAITDDGPQLLTGNPVPAASVSR